MFPALYIITLREASNGAGLKMTSLNAVSCQRVNLLKVDDFIARICKNIKISMLDFKVRRRNKAQVRQRVRIADSLVKRQSLRLSEVAGKPGVSTSRNLLYENKH
jgi:hypothetical protein